MSNANAAREYHGPAQSVRIGLVAALLTVVVWTTWIVSTRFAVQGAEPVNPGLLAFIRFGTAALVLSPHWWRLRLIPRAVSPWVSLGLLFAGLPYLGAVLVGLTHAPAMEAGPLLTGTLPLFVAGLSALCLGERFTRLRLVGLLLIGLGTLAIIGHSLLQSGSASWYGHLFILLAALSWSVYTVAFRKSGLSAIAAASLIGLWSTLILLPFAGQAAWEALQQTPWAVLLQQLFIQGFMAGILALITFATAVTHLGASRTAAITAITPASALITATWLLGEHPDLFALLGCGLIVAGVVLASGALARKDPANDRDHR